MTGDAASARCPRCGAAFACGAGDAAPCRCAALVLTPALRAWLRDRFDGCLCLDCLRELASRDAAGPGDAARGSRAHGPSRAG